MLIASLNCGATSVCHYLPLYFSRKAHSHMGSMAMQSTSSSLLLLWADRPCSLWNMTARR